MKMVSRVLLTAAVIAAFAAPAMAADKLIVKNAAGTGTAFKVDDAGTLIVRDAADTMDVFKVTNNGTISTAGFYYDGATKLTGMGTTAPSGALSVTATNSVSTRGLVVSQHTNNAAGGVIAFRKSRGTDPVPATVVSGDYNAAFAFKNHDGSSWLANAGFGARVNGTVTTGSVPTELFFWNNPANTTDAFASNSVRMMVSATGNIGIGTVTPTSKLQVVGLPTYADNAAALAGGLTAGAFYRTSTGVLMVAY